MVNRPIRLNAFAFQFIIVMLVRADHAQVGKGKAMMFVIKFQKRECRILVRIGAPNPVECYVSISLNARRAIRYMDQT